MLRKGPFDTVVFDCDSTLSTIEGVDELARRAGVYDACCALTNASMDGHVPLEDVYAKRLDQIQPCRAELDWLGQLYVENITPGAIKLVAELLNRNRRVCIISGGLLPAVQVLARELTIPFEDVFAVDIFFHEDGSYKDFDRTSPLSRAGGKADIIRTLKSNGSNQLACVGDGITDLDMQMDDVLFIGYGGVQSREKVRIAADIFIDDPSLLSLLPLVLHNE
jgi:phosphoserine phosphatase